MHQVHMKHARPCVSECALTEVFHGIWGSQIYCPLFPEKASLGLGLDAPELEMSQVVLGTSNQELEIPFPGKQDVNNM